MIRAAVVDDHPRLIAAVRGIFAETSDITVVGEAQDGAGLSGLLANVAIDVLVLDLHLPDRGWPNIFAELRSHHPGLRVVAFTSTPATELLHAVLHAGARGYVEKSYAAEELPLAVHVVMNGARYIPSEPSVVSQAEDARLLEVNHRFTEVFGYARQELLGAPVEQLRLWQNFALRRALVARALSDGRVKSRAGFRDKDGRLWDADVVIWPLRRYAAPTPVVCGQLQC